MPELKKKEIVKVILPSFDDGSAYVMIETPANMIDFEGLSVTGNESQVRQSAMIVAMKIKEWNLTQDGQPLEINVDNVLALDAADFGTLTITLGLDKVMSNLTRAKKNSSSNISVPSAPITQ